MTFVIAGEAGKQFHQMTYDLTGRMNLTLARAFGYQGKMQAELDATLQRGALLQLLYQSPTGDMPFGGRSNQQNFNEATFALICEYEANYYWQHGDRELAGLFKRAAALAFAAVRDYIDSQPVFFTKNFFPQVAEVVHGRQASYGWYSPYALLIASQFGFAARLANPDIPQLRWNTRRRLQQANWPSVCPPSSRMGGRKAAVA